jgi:hypothetical protein
MNKKIMQEIAEVIHREFERLPLNEYSIRLKEIETQLTNHIPTLLKQLAKNDLDLMGEIRVNREQNVQLAKITSNIRDVLLPYTPFAKGKKD